MGHLNVDSIKKLVTLTSGLEKLIFCTSEILRDLLGLHTFFSDCLIKNKSDVCDATRNYIFEAESKGNLRIYKLCCDMGGGYVANELTDWCRERGINIYYAPAATPQLNG
ncbi:hypothetical protein PR048_019999 [Dryococelus australis]|uniref:Integrase catalytic domain-containing protein n=1 Tax=Dryococelus australis TaxID=614101 RepID=A0ABQ9H519_9NEOP|nr:hypothetical protein PR048_019999 [Dryococelus australis]